MFETDADKPRVVLVAVEDVAGTAEASLNELSDLAAHYEVVGRLVQRREMVHRAHYLGKGKLEELKTMAQDLDAWGIICDDELTNSQIKNMGDVLGVEILDRTMVILQIFSERATTAEGKLQVELANLRYRLGHLTGRGVELSRIGGGASGTHTRGAGETKLETDRRAIRSRIGRLSDELEKLKSQRNTSRRQRERNHIPGVSLVGYTNAGKSTLMNALTKAGVLAENKLFATLDTTTRKLYTESGNILLTDTVGFINKLPHTLIMAFRATLEELLYADLILHVVDASNPERENQMKVVYDCLKELGCGQKPVITVYNKIDLDTERPLPIDSSAIEIVEVSAKKGIGIEQLVEVMARELSGKATV